MRHTEREGGGEEVMLATELATGAYRKSEMMRSGASYSAFYGRKMVNLQEKYPGSGPHLLGTHQSKRCEPMVLGPVFLFSIFTLEQALEGLLQVNIWLISDFATWSKMLEIGRPHRPGWRD